jgi:hypothetical protein
MDDAVVTVNCSMAEVVTSSVNNVVVAELVVVLIVVSVVVSSMGGMGLEVPNPGRVVLVVSVDDADVAESPPFQGHMLIDLFDPPIELYDNSGIVVSVRECSDNLPTLQRLLVSDFLPTLLLLLLLILAMVDLRPTKTTRRVVEWIICLAVPHGAVWGREWGAR